jgi:hypothetical protein
MGEEMIVAICQWPRVRVLDNDFGVFGSGDNIDGGGFFVRFVSVDAEIFALECGKA